MDHLIADLAGAGDYWTAYHVASVAIPQVAHGLVQYLAEELGDIAQSAYATAADQVASSLPTKTLAVAAMERLHVQEGWLHESTNLGAVLLTYSKSGYLRVTDRLGRLQEPAFSTRSEAAQRRAFRKLILPPLPASQIQAIVEPSGGAWPASLTSSIAPPDRLAATISALTTKGASRAQIAKALEREFGATKAAAMRIARTEGVRISQTAKLQAWEKMGTAVIGYQLRATMDARTRPHHAARNGQIYYRNPTGDQLGFDAMPHPPFEPNVSPWHGSLAWNCRCMLSPVFAPPESLLGSPDRLLPFTNNAGKVIPDPDSYSLWFARVDERRRRVAVGTRRYETVAKALDREPLWSDFLDRDGELVPLETLNQENTADRETRQKDVQQLLLKRRGDFRRILTFGFDGPSVVSPPAAVATPRPAPRRVDLKDPWNAQALARAQERLAQLTATDQTSDQLRRGLLEQLRQRAATPQATAELLHRGSEASASFVARKGKQAGPVHRAKVADALKFLEPLLGGDQGVQFTYNGTGKRRAYHRQGQVHFHRDSDVATIVHEAGHAIEYTHPEIAQACRAFLQKRTAGESLQKLNRVIGPGHRPDEVGRLGSFDRAFGKLGWYVGKHYPWGATEVLSMGLEKLYTDPVHFAERDPDYFNFVLGIMHGRLR